MLPFKSTMLVEIYPIKSASLPQPKSSCFSTKLLWSSNCLTFLLIAALLIYVGKSTLVTPCITNSLGSIEAIAEL